MINLAEIRVFRSESMDGWESVPVSAYLPILVFGDGMADNIFRRLRVSFFKQDLTITQIRWNVKGASQDGHWIKREDL